MSRAATSWGARFLTAALTCLLATPAAAQDYCAQVRAEIASLQSGGNAADYQRLLQSYNSLYAAANAQGCIRIIRRLIPPGCEGILAQLSSVQAQLDAAQRPAFGQGDAAWRARRLGELQGALAAYCSAPAQAPAPRQSITLCVRTCDGYFFPIGFRSNRDDYERDALLCQARCPNQEVMLFLRPSGESPIEEAVSIGGDTYAELLNAFRFREGYHPECGCTPADGGVSIAEYGLRERFDDLISRPSANSQTIEGIREVRDFPPIPRHRPEPSEDPETLANRAGGFDPVGAGLPAQPTVLLGDAGIRLVGPAHLYAR